MTRKTIVLAGGLGLALAGIAEPAVRDRSVLGWWRFDGGDYTADSSGYGRTLTLASGKMSGNAGATYGTGSCQHSGCLDITTKGEMASATLSGTVGTYFTVATRFKSNCDTLSLSYFERLLLDDTDEARIDSLLAAINDHDNWHFAAMRYQKDAAQGSTMSWMITADPTTAAFWGVSSRAEVASDDQPKFPVAVSAGSTSAKVGGSIGASSKNTQYAGGIDEAMVINRFLSKSELTRLCQSGETYVYSSGTPSFTTYSGWSTSLEVGTVTFDPGYFPGAAYIVDSGKTLTAFASGAFGGDVAKQLSLTLGRTGSLLNLLTGETLVSNTAGNFSQGAGTEIAFYDLRLNDGTITAGGTSLSTTLLDVEAPAAKPFVLAAANDFVLNVGAATTGSGVLSKTGAGKLSVNAWTGTAKLRLSEGSIRTPRFNGYAGGTVFVSTDSTVAFAGDDVLPTTANKMKILFDGTKPTAKTAVMTVPSGVTAAMIQDTTEYANGQVGLVTVENGTVSVEPVYPEDQGAVPVLMAE